MLIPLAVLPLGPSVAASHGVRSRESAARAVLSEAATAAIMGGAAADVTLSFPPNFIGANTTTHTVAWNMQGNRCQFDCSQGNTGPTDVGEQASARAWVLAGSPGPVLEILSDGRRRAKAQGTKNTFLSDSNYDVYDFSIRTRCLHTKTCNGVAGATPCTMNADCGGGFNICDFSFCTLQGGCGLTDVCVTADGAGNVQDPTQVPPVLGPCLQTCSGGTNNDKDCTVAADCPGGTCVSSVTGSATCFLLTDCATNGPCGPITTHDCRTTGAPIVGANDPLLGKANQLGTAPMHSFLGRVLGTGVLTASANCSSAPTSAGAILVGIAENHYRTAQANVPGGNAETTCSNNCDGAPEPVIGGPILNCGP